MTLYRIQVKKLAIWTSEIIVDLANVSYVEVGFTSNSI